MISYPEILLLGGVVAAVCYIVLHYIIPDLPDDFLDKLKNKK